LRTIFFILFYFVGYSSTFAVLLSFLRYFGADQSVEAVYQSRALKGKPGGSEVLNIRV
jgi:hypothetical protein